MNNEAVATLSWSLDVTCPSCIKVYTHPAPAQPVDETAVRDGNIFFTNIKQLQKLTGDGT